MVLLFRCVWYQKYDPIIVINLIVFFMDHEDIRGSSDKNISCPSMSSFLFGDLARQGSGGHPVFFNNLSTVLFAVRGASILGLESQ